MFFKHGEYVINVDNINYIEVRENGAIYVSFGMTVLHISGEAKKALLNFLISKNKLTTYIPGEVND